MTEKKTSDQSQTRRTNLKRLLTPRHIAFVGGRAVEASINLCRASGFKGNIWTVHPKHREIAGIPCVASVADLPEPPDASLIAVSRTRTIDVVAQLAALGAGGAVSITGEFAETDNQGQILQKALQKAAGDLALVGPNCLGILNQFDGVAVWGGGNVYTSVPQNGIALISQSGYVAYSVSNVERAFPLGYVISMGNQAVLDAADFIDAMLDDNRVRAIGLYLEGLVDVAALSRAAMRALDSGVPLVVLKTGGTRESAELTKSHSGTLAVSNELWSTLFRRLGMVEVGSPKALVETLKLLGIADRSIGKRVYCAANSGGYTALISDKGRRLGLEFPLLTVDQQKALRERVPDLVHLSNPLDYNLPWASLSDPVIAETGLGILLDERCDLLVYFIDYPHLANVADVWRPTIDGIIRLSLKTRKTIAIASVLPEGLPLELRTELHAVGIPTLQGLDESMVAIAAAAHHASMRQEYLADPEPLGRLLPDPGTPSGHPVMLDEWQGKQHLAGYGLTVSEGATGALEDIMAAADKLGFPVAVKLLNKNLAHKHKAGAVCLDLHSREEIETSVAAIGTSVSAYDAELDTSQFLVERMIPGACAEFIIGVKHEPGLGLALLIGRGGTKVEELHDYETLLLPASDRQILTAIQELTIVKHLELNWTAQNVLLKAVRAITCFAETNRERLLELDVNPIILCDNNEAIAADALIRWSPAR